MESVLLATEYSVPLISALFGTTAVIEIKVLRLDCNLTSVHSCVGWGFVFSGGGDINMHWLPIVRKTTRSKREGKKRTPKRVARLNINVLLDNR